MLRSPALSTVNSLLKALEAERDYYNAEPYRVDGTIVGNGSQDFTKNYTTYSFKINDVSTQLIDCPGIEGNEEKFRQIINDALKKCHLVCYVAREAKGIESKTLERIKTYLGENVEVLGIQNIPFNPTREYDGEDYDLDMRRRIARDSVSRRNIEKALLSVLPQELYLQTLSIAALPGLCAVACRDDGTTLAKPEDFPANGAVRESIETLCRQQRNFVRHTTPEKLLNSSRILELKSEIEACCENAPIRIKRNAYLRLLQALREVYLVPLSNDEGALKRIKLTKCREIDAYVRSVTDANGQMSRNMRYAVRDAVDEFFRCDVLDEIIYPHIERNENIDEPELSSELEAKKQLLNKALKKRISTAITLCAEEFVKRIKQYTGDLVHGGELDVKGVSVNIPWLQGESFSFSDLGVWAMDIGGYAIAGASIGSAYPVIGTAVGAVIGTFVGVCVSILRFFETKGRKITRLKNEAREKVEESAQNLFNQIEPEIKKIAEKLSGTTAEGIKKAENKKAAICATHEVLVASIKELKKIERSVVGLTAEKGEESERVSTGRSSTVNRRKNDKRQSKR